MLMIVSVFIVESMSYGIRAIDSPPDSIDAGCFFLPENVHLGIISAINNVRPFFDGYCG
jgi:hypothetical protein